MARMPLQVHDGCGGTGYNRLVDQYPVSAFPSIRGKGSGDSSMLHPSLDLRHSNQPSFLTLVVSTGRRFQASADAARRGRRERVGDERV